jgi:hypothetical protein
MLLLPGGWVHTSHNTSDIDATEEIIDEHLVLYVVVHEKDGTYSFAVVNTNGESLKYHATKPDALSTDVARNTALHFKGIPGDRLFDGSFWFMLLRMVSHPGKRNSPETLYGILLPYLNQQPFLSNTSAEESDWSVLEHTTEDNALLKGVGQTVLATVRFALQRTGLSKPKTTVVMAMLQAGLLAMAHNDLGLIDNLSGSEEVLLNSVCRRAAVNVGAAAAVSGVADATFAVGLYSEVRSITEGVTQLISELREPARKAEALQPLKLDTTVKKEGNADFPLLGRMRRDFDVEALIGDARLEPILRPIELTLVADRVTTFNDVTTAMRHAVHLCTLMGNQSSLIKNTYCLRLSLLQHLLTTVIPLPLPHNHPDRDTRCFWAAAVRAEPMRHETQTDLLRLLHLICRHYAACCLSVKVTRSFDATRILTVGCIAAIADAVLRVKCIDVPNMLSLHYTGEAPGPVHPFGFEMNHFARESAMCLLTTPDLQTARTQVLDYFHQQRADLQDTHVLFKYEESMGLGTGESLLIDQLCVQMGFPRGVEDPEAGPEYRPNVLARYLSGEDPVLLDNYPELGLFRDIVFTFKLLQVPTNDGLPELRPWLATDAALAWSFKEKDDEAASRFVVKGFQSKALSCAYTHQEDHHSHKSSGVMGKVKGFFGMVTLPRAPPSGADPSNLLEVSDDCATEDDILHIKELPDFDKTLSGRDSARCSF